MHVGGSMDTASNWGMPPPPGSFLQWQIDFIDIVQGALYISPNLLQVLLWLGSPLVTCTIAFVWSILIDFTGGLGLLAVLCEATIVAKTAQSIAKLPRPFWITRQLRVGETTPAACTHSTTFGFPALQVVLVTAAVSYLSAYISVHRDRWSTWFYDNESLSSEARQRKLWIRVLTLMIVISCIGFFLVLAESITVLYTGINFLHDVIFAVLIGFGVTVLHVSLIQPLVVNPMCRYSLRTNTSKGLAIPLTYSFIVGGLVPLLFSSSSFVLSSMISFPDREWERIAWAHCGSTYHIAGDEATYVTVFKMSGVLCGLCVSFCPLLVKYVPVHLTFRRAGLSGIFVRIGGYAIVTAPLVFIGTMVHMFGMKEIYKLHNWWLMFFGMGMEFAMYAIGTVWLFVCTPFLLHLWNERSISMRIRFYERLVYYRRERPRPLLERMQAIVRRSLDFGRQENYRPFYQQRQQQQHEQLVGQSSHPIPEREGLRKDFTFPREPDIISSSSNRCDVEKGNAPSSSSHG